MQTKSRVWKDIFEKMFLVQMQKINVCLQNKANVNRWLIFFIFVKRSLFEHLPPADKQGNAPGGKQQLRQINPGRRFGGCFSPRGPWTTVRFCRNLHLANSSGPGNNALPAPIQPRPRENAFPNKRPAGWILSSSSAAGLRRFTARRHATPAADSLIPKSYSAPKSIY